MRPDVFRGNLTWVGLNLSQVPRGGLNSFKPPSLPLYPLKTGTNQIRGSSQEQIYAGALGKISLFISQQPVTAEPKAFTLSNVYGDADSRIAQPFVMHGDPHLRAASKGQGCLVEPKDKANSM